MVDGVLIILPDSRIHLSPHLAESVSYLHGADKNLKDSITEMLTFRYVAAVDNPHHSEDGLARGFFDNAQLLVRSVIAPGHEEDYRIICQLPREQPRIMQRKEFMAGLDAMVAKYCNGNGNP
jgi:sporulation-control protein spo0M